MSQPSCLSVKRKAQDPPPDYLVLHGAKRTYVRQKRGDNRVITQDGRVKGGEQVPHPQNVPATSTNTSKHQRQAGRRFFQLQHAQHPTTDVTGKRRDREDIVATFVEKKPKRDQDVEARPGHEAQSEETAAERPLKRPGRGTAVRRMPNKPVNPERAADRGQAEALADYMHQAALEEIKRESRPKRVATPKLSGARSRELHQQRAATNGSTKVDNETRIEDEDDFVYDTYILAPTTENGATKVDASEVSELDNVGYLMITKEDQSLWETYFDDEVDDENWNSDEDDENAEGYYGADYPEDELAMDDEFDRNAYGYRGRGSDDEEWDGDTAAYSDDEYDRMMVPLKHKKTLQQFAKYLEDDNENE